MRAGILSCCLSVLSVRCQPGIEQCHQGLTYRLQGSGSLPTSICAAEDCQHPTKGRGSKALHATPAVQGVKALPAACFTSPWASRAASICWVWPPYTWCKLGLPCMPLLDRIHQPTQLFCGGYIHMFLQLLPGNSWSVWHTLMHVSL